MSHATPGATDAMARVLSLFDKVQKYGHGFRVLCPLHEDTKPSMDVKYGEKGILVGCPVCNHGMPDVAERFDVPQSFFFYERIENVSESEVTYTYVDEGGTPLFRVVRGPQKRFFQQKFVNGEWENGVAGVRIVPYHLDEIVGADPKRMVFIAEGEKDCDNLRKYGCLASCNPGGAGKWRDQYSEHFRGRNVCIFYDLDPRTRYAEGHPQAGQYMLHEDGRPIRPGWDHATSVARSLTKCAPAFVRIIHLPGLEKDSKCDISDWLEKNSLADLRALVSTACDWDNSLVHPQDVGWSPKSEQEQKPAGEVRQRGLIKETVNDHSHLLAAAERVIALSSVLDAEEFDIVARALFEKAMNAKPD